MRAASSRSLYPVWTEMADLPHELSELKFLALNLRWSWHAETRALFEQLGPALWTAVRHNPALLLRRSNPISLHIAANNPTYTAAVRRAADELRHYLTTTDTWYASQQRALAGGSMTIAYFSAEFAITEALPIFSG